MFQPQSALYGSSAYGVGSQIPSVAFHSQPRPTLGSVPGARPSTFSYTTVSQPVFRPPISISPQHQTPDMSPGLTNSSQHGGHYNFRSQVKMHDTDIQQVSDIAAQQAAARDYKLESQGPLVGEKTPSEAITEEYAKADPIYVAKTIALPQTYSHYRSIRGDGNCGWRAIAFAYFEHLVNRADRSLIEGELARLLSFNNFLEAQGYDMDLLSDMIDETIELLRTLALNAQNPAAGMNQLMARFSDEGVDNAIIYHMRLLAAATIKADPTPYDAFIPHNIGTEEFVKSSIELPNQEIEQIGINLLVKALLEPAGLSLEIAYLDRTPGSEVNTYRFPETTSPDDPSTLCLLFRPDHYDIVYRRPQPPPIQVNRAMNFTNQLQITATPAMGAYSSVDITPLASLMPVFGELSSMSPMGGTQDAPLPANYSSSGAQPWQVVSSLPNQMAPPAISRPFTAPDVPPPPTTRPTIQPVHSLPSTVAIEVEHPVRFSKYNYPKLCEESGFSEPQFRTSAFRNSHHNKAHYNNDQFQPELYNPNDESGGRSGHRKRGS